MLVKIYRWKVWDAEDNYLGEVEACSSTDARAVARTKWPLSAQRGEFVVVRAPGRRFAA